MILLVLGVALWAAAHLCKRLMPERRAAMGDKGKGIVALALAVSILLMIFGYRSVGEIFVWSPPSFMVHINNTLMVIALYLTSPGPKKGALFYKMRHPMLAGFGLWCLAHLLVNGDLASIILWGGLWAWAIASVKIINAAEPNWTPGPKGSISKDAMFFVASIVLLGVIGFIHGLIGPSPFPG
ncbi:NnrU family protein [Pseudoprimorskyibacter insulae]|uniref:NnrU domain-containing protein n=1 Tax=Pseudoprimorskyibacter insulae TaxID=1695997 RepID=A0A2R8AP34_9RHOB|nr:NnrU family protein [Pseudoprimorskyibacter insulae]SPF77826.1 hypothetical protein PRI8871_00412 [Pseudoprimorskyibacter insulae]